MRAAYHWADDHPFLVAVLLVSVVAVPGYLRVEWLASRAAQTAEESARTSAEVSRLVKIQARIDQRIAEELARQIVTDCQVRNSAQRRERQTTNLILDRLLAGGGNKTMVDRVRAQIPDIEGYETTDCDGDGEITDADFLPVRLGGR